MPLVWSRRRRLIVLALVLLGLGAVGAAIAAREFIPAEAGALNQQLQELHLEKSRVQQRLRRVKQRQRRVTRQLASLEIRLDRTEERLQLVTQSASKARADLADAVRECRSAETRLSGHREAVAERLVAVYKQGELRPAALLLLSTSFADLANRLYLLDQIIAHDAELLDGLESAHEEAEEYRALVTERERKLSALERKIKSEMARTSAERKAAAENKRRLLRDRVVWERALAELEENSREVTAMLQRLRHTPGGQARLAAPWKGKLLRPVAGPITSGYGYRIHPIHRVRKMHTGIDIAASTGTPIRAAAPGTVVHSARWGGYGNCIIIDHGGGLATLYGHCSRLAVRAGQAVKQGEVVGYVGSTGLSTGPHLHFEVRRDGRPVNPNPYL